MSKWAVMVCLDGKDDWIFVTETTEHCWDLKPVLFDKMKMTPQEIFEYKNAWKPGYRVDVHSDLDVQCKSWCRGNLNRWEWSMDTYTDVYSHSFYFEHESAAFSFTQKFAEWINKGKG